MSNHDLGKSIDWLFKIKVRVSWVSSVTPSIFRYYLKEKMPADGDQVKMVATTAKTSLASVGRGSQSCRHVSGMSPNVGACLQGVAAPLTMARLLPQS